MTSFKDHIVEDCLLIRQAWSLSEHQLYIMDSEESVRNVCNFINFIPRGIHTHTHSTHTPQRDGSAVILFQLFSKIFVWDKRGGGVKGWGCTINHPQRLTIIPCFFVSWVKKEYFTGFLFYSITIIILIYRLGDLFFPISPNYIFSFHSLSCSFVLSHSLSLSLPLFPYISLHISLPLSPPFFQPPTISPPISSSHTLSVHSPTWVCVKDRDSACYSNCFYHPRWSGYRRSILYPSLPVHC